MSKHHRDRSWAPAPQPLPDDAHVIDNHTHVASVVPFSRAMSHEAAEKGQPEVPVYSVDELLSQAQAVGVEGVIDCGCELPNLMTAIDMAREHPDAVHAAIAIHPNESVLHGHRGVPGPDGLPLKYKPWHDVNFDDAMAEVHRLAVTYPKQVVAIGETGMDLFRTGSRGAVAQREAFRAHIALAKDLDLPLQIHDRDAHAACVEVLEADGAPERTVFHCFSGDREMAEVCADNGWYASFAGPLTYPANDSLREAFLAVPDRLVLVETDAPYLTPAPWRGHPNAPYAAAYTARFMAELRGRDEASWCEQLEANTREVYGI